MRRPKARRTDPATSHTAAAANRASRQTHTRMMLEAFAYAGDSGFTDYEAAQYADLDVAGICWWHRASDLRAQGLIAWLTHPDGTRHVVRGVNGVSVGVSVITKAACATRSSGHTRWNVNGPRLPPVLGVWIVGTGNPMPEEMIAADALFHGTCVMENNLVWHVFSAVVGEAANPTAEPPQAYSTVDDMVEQLKARHAERRGGE